MRRAVAPTWSTCSAVHLFSVDELAMCGIAGWVGDIADDDLVCQRVLQSLRHRGPDGDGVFRRPGAALIHTRLSIIDRSSAGAQPMPNEERNVWAVFNGEIYNHRELRL